MNGILDGSRENGAELAGLDAGVMLFLHLGQFSARVFKIYAQNVKDFHEDGSLCLFGNRDFPSLAVFRVNIAESLFGAVNALLAQRVIPVAVLDHGDPVRIVLDPGADRFEEVLINSGKAARPVDQDLACG